MLDECVTVCAHTCKVERSCSSLHLSRQVSSCLLLSTSTLQNQKDRQKTEVCACVCVGGLSFVIWWPPITAMRRAFSVFRGYRRAGEDDDEVFVCSPGYKVIEKKRSASFKWGYFQKSGVCVQCPLDLYRTECQLWPHRWILCSVRSDFSVLFVKLPILVGELFIRTGTQHQLLFSRNC